MTKPAQQVFEIGKYAKHSDLPGVIERFLALLPSVDPMVAFCQQWQPPMEEFLSFADWVDGHDV